MRSKFKIYISAFLTRLENYSFLKIAQHKLQESVISANIFMKSSLILLTVALYSVQLRFGMEYIIIHIIFRNFKRFYG